MLRYFTHAQAQWLVKERALVSPAHHDVKAAR